MTASQYSDFSLEPSPIVPTGHHVDPNIAIGPGAVRHQEAADTTNESPIATLQSRSGRPISAHEAGPRDIVTVFGSQTTVANAIHMGILQRHPATGALVETGKTKEQLLGIREGATPAASPASNGGDKPHRAPALSRAAEQFRDVLRGSVPGTELAGAYASYIEQGKLTDLTVNRIASHLMITPEQAAENLSLYAEALDDQRARALSSFGVTDIEGFEAWAKQAKPGMFKQARTEQITQGSVSGYRTLAQIYFENLDTIDTERVMSADFGSGITPRLSGGKVILNIPGVGQVPYRTAVSRGIVKVR